MAENLTGGWRTVQTVHGDTLQALALRELGDAARWPEIAWLNHLLPPYLVADSSHPLVATARVVVYGGTVKVPSVGTQSRGLNAADAFGTDLQWQNGDLTITDGGDLAVLAGVPNLVQALERRLRADLGELPFHARYGNQAHRLKGHKNTPEVLLLALRFCEEALLSDPRVRSVRDGSAQAEGDAIRVFITAVVDDAAPLRLQLTL